MSGRRLYSEKEINAVLKRAAELQRTEHPAEPHGLSQEELEQIAVEVGLDPAFIRTALAELDTGEPTEEAFHFWGGPLKLEEELVIDGEVSEDEWATMVPEIRQALGGMGSTGQLGRAFELILKNNTNQEISVTVTPYNGRTRLTIFTKGSDVAGGFHAGLNTPAFVLGIIVIFVSGLPLWLTIPGALLVLTSMFMLTRMLYGGWYRKQKRTFRKLLTKMEALAGPAETSTQDQIPTTAQAAALLNLNTETPESTEEDRLPSSRTRT